MTTQANKNQQQSSGALAAYRALSIAAERIGLNNYLASRRLKTKFHVTESHRRVMEAMPKVLSGSISAESAMAILHEYDVFEERLARTV